jgi:hypothetical protein
MKKTLINLGMILLMITLCLSGCQEKKGDDGNQKQFDSRLFGSWKNGNFITFHEDGTYEVMDGERSDWYTENNSSLWMYGTVYAYELSENNTHLTLIRDSYPTNYEKI